MIDYYVQINDVFDETTPTVMETRINNAFGADGTDFWENFFFCGKYHPSEKEIYLFTEYQLEFLWNWWNKEINSGNINVKLNLDYSKQKLFNALPNGKKIKEIHVCYVMNIPGCLELRRVRFGAQPTRYLSIKNLVNIDFFNRRPKDFFDGRFNREPSSIPDDEGKYRKKLLELLNLRKKIANEFGGPEYIIDDNGVIKKWVRYLAPKHDTKLPIEYCVDICPNCPLAKQF